MSEKTAWDDDPLTGSGPDLDPLARLALISSPTAQILLDSAGRLTLSNHRACELFAVSQRDTGRPFEDLDVSRRPAELRGLVAEAMVQRRTTWVRGLEVVSEGGETSALELQIVPLHDGDGVALGATLVFHDVTRDQRLQGELRSTHRQLQAAYAELRSTNAELETTNTELQSTNEELETMNDELQLTNDELRSSNDALRDRQEEVDRLRRFTSAEPRTTGARAEVADDE